MLRVAITRAQPEADRTAERVRARGHEAIIAPLLQIVPCGYDTNTEGAQAIIFTSINGVRGFPNAAGAGDQLVLTVGNRTAEAAREAGFNYVMSADGDGADLAAFALSLLDPSKGKLIHFTGSHVAPHMTQNLRKAGFTLEQRQAYESVALPMQDVLREPLDIVLFHSPRAAQRFIALGAPTRGRVAGCLSNAIAEVVGKAPWKRIITAPHPREDDLLTATLGG